MTIYSVYMVFEVALGIPLWASLLLIGVFSVIYDTIGGMEAVVWSDVVQMGVILLGVGLCTWTAVDRCGGVVEVVRIYARGSAVVETSPGSSGTFDLSLSPGEEQQAEGALRTTVAATGLPAMALSGMDWILPFTEVVPLDRPPRRSAPEPTFSCSPAWRSGSTCS